jgi:hypothetical protein
MSFERSVPGTGIGAEPAPTPAAGGGALPSQMRLQILSTEHWSLLASRSLAWNESFSRAGMFLTTLSGAMVALALVAQASAFDQGFVLFALVVLPITLFVGVATFLRMGAANWHDARCVEGMNRIRGAYLELAPELAPYFVMSANDDARGIGITMGMPPHRGQLIHLISAAPMTVMSLDSVLTAVITALATIQLGGGIVLALALAAIGFAVSVALHMRVEHNDVIRGQRSLEPLFPSGGGGPEAA